MDEETTQPETIEAQQPKRVFNSALFSQLEGIEKLSPESKTAEGLPAAQPESETVILEAEDVEGLVVMPFDFMAFKTKYPGWQLDEKQTKSMCRLWLKPIQRLCGKYKQTDLLIAAITTAGIFMEKSLEYRIECDNRTRNERQRENELP